MDSHSEDIRTAETGDEALVGSETVTVSVSRETLKKLTLGADAFREVWNAARDRDSHDVLNLMDPLLLDHLTDVGLVSPYNGRSTEAFDIACTLGGIALGVTAGLSAVGREPRANGEAAPCGAAMSGVSASNADNDDFEDDVAAAEAALTRSIDPDWPGEPVPSVLNALPRAASFGGD